MNEETAIDDLFAGPGGWDTGLRMIGRTDVTGIEWDAVACATARAAGHRRVQADVSALRPADFRRTRPEGQIGSPPCKGFSLAGLGKGRGDAGRIVEAVHAIGLGVPADFVMYDLAGRCADHRSALVLEPLRWALAAEPEWLAWEQVATVLPLWEACAEVLRSRGWNVWAGNVRAEQYGVPQTRRRAILLAHRSRPVGRPAPTHSRYHSADPARLDPGLPRWVSMAEALGRAGITTPGSAMRSNYGTGGDPRNRGIRLVSQPAPTVTSKIGRNKWVPSAAGVTVAEAAVLQTFPADYPFAGTKGDQYRQVGDAVPPLLAAHLLASLGVGELPITQGELTA